MKKKIISSVLIGCLIAVTTACNTATETTPTIEPSRKSIAVVTQIDSTITSETRICFMTIPDQNIWSFTLDGNELSLDIGDVFTASFYNNGTPELIDDVVLIKSESDVVVIDSVTGGYTENEEGNFRSLTWFYYDVEKYYVEVEY